MQPSNSILSEIDSKINTLDQALALADLGFSVFPCNPDKTPRTRSGFKLATTDPAIIQSWGAKWAGGLIGIACAPSGIFALDIDTKNGTPGFGSLAELIDTAGEGQPLAPVTGPIQSTPSGGAHYLYKLPHGVKIPNTAGKLAPGLDLRSDGYICTGPGYTWQPGHEPETPLTEAPAWLLAEIDKLTPKKQPTPATIAQAKKYSDDPQEKGNYWLGKALAQAYEGNRNDTAFRMGQQLRDAGLPLPEAERIACDYAAQVPGDDFTEAEALEAIRSAYRGTQREPARKISGGNGNKPQTQGAQMASYTTPETEQRPELKPTDPTPGDLDLNDIGNGLRLAWRHGHRLRYVSEWGWLAWDGKTWQKDRGETAEACKETARSIFAEAAACEDDPRRATIAKFAAVTSNLWKWQAMEKSASSLPTISARPDQFDTNPWLLNCQNGILDLKTGELQPHDPAAMLSKITGTDYDPGGRCPLWLAFLDRVFSGDQELINFVQKATGYSLAGNTGEQLLFFLYGHGANGKSTFTGAIQDVMGSYSRKVRAEALMTRRSDAIPEEVAQLAGVRLALAAELGEGQRLNESLVKDLTGGDRLSARLLHKNSFEFIPIAKMWLYGNHKPTVKGTDEGIWRRVKLIPFTVTIPPEERDKNLPEKLRAELPGILAWAVRGCLAWQREGLDLPQAVKAATDDYRAEQDTLAAFLSECCVINSLASVTAGDLYTAYKAWAEQSGLNPISKIALSRQLSERGLSATGRQAGTGRAVYTGLGLLAEREIL
jgi:putative DNA primase/helicase